MRSPLRTYLLSAPATPHRPLARPLPCSDPRFGRTEENFGSDPLLVAKMAEAAVVGLQASERANAPPATPGGCCAPAHFAPRACMQGGAQPPTNYLPTPGVSVATEAKHCCAYGFSGLDGGAADVSAKTLHDVYMRPWRAYIRAGGSGLMMSHNEINGVPMVSKRRTPASHAHPPTPPVFSTPTGTSSRASSATRGTGRALSTRTTATVSERL